MAIVYFAASSETVVERVQAGVDRVSLGLEVLRAMDDVPGYGGFGERARWTEIGLQGWSQNPLFGHGVEAFRADFGSSVVPSGACWHVRMAPTKLFWAL